MTTLFEEVGSGSSSDVQVRAWVTGTLDPTPKVKNSDVGVEDHVAPSPRLSWSFTHRSYRESGTGPLVVWEEKCVFL